MAPKEDTVYVRAGSWIQLGEEVRYISRDTFFVLGPATPFELINNDKSQSFFDSLEAKFGRHRLTRELGDLVLRRPRGSTPVDDNRLEEARALFLPYEGRTIGRISFQQVDLFDGSVIDTGRTARTWIGKALNDLHVSTRPSVLRRFLLFQEGEPLNPDRLADSERLLRALSYIEDARIYVVPHPGNPRLVDVHIFTKDRFSIGVEGSMQKLDRFRGGLYDNNFLGLGIEMGHQLLFNQDYRSPFGYTGRLHFNNLGRHLVTTDLDYIYTAKVNELTLRLDRGFFTPEIKYAGGFELARTHRFRAQLASDGIEVETPYRANYYDLWAGRSFLLPGREVRNNLSIAVRYVGVQFDNRPPVTPTDNFFFHKRDLALANLTFISRRFLRSRNFTGFGDTEDIPTGGSIALTGGYEFGEFQQRPYAGGDIAMGCWMPGLGYLGLEATVSAFRGYEQWEDGLLRLHGLYFTPMLRMRQFRFRQLLEVSYLQGINRLMPGEQIDFRKSLRNFPSEWPNGQNRLTVRLESILFTPWNMYGFKTALFAFGDFGYLTYQGRYSGFRSSIGIGARLRNRSLVLQTIEFRLAYLPYINDNDPRHWFPDYHSTDPRLFLNLNPTKPLLPRFGE